MLRAAWIASAISAEVTEPNSLPSSPARWWIVSTVLESSAEVSPGALGGLLLGLSARSRLRCASSSAPLVAGWASLRGTR